MDTSVDKYIMHVLYALPFQPMRAMRSDSVEKRVYHNRYQTPRRYNLPKDTSAVRSGGYSGAPAEQASFLAECIGTQDTLLGSKDQCHRQRR